MLIKGRFAIKTFIAACLCLMVSVVCAAGEVMPWLADTSSAGQYPANHLQILEDPTGMLTLDAVQAPSLAERWMTPSARVPNFGFSTSAHWARLQLKAAPGQSGNYLLELAYPLMDSIRFYSQTGDGSWAQRDDGDRLPLSVSGRQYRHPLLPLVLSDNQTTAVYVRLNSSDSMIPAFRLWYAPQFEQWQSNERYINGLYYGAILAILLYNLLILVSVRQSIYLGYVAIIAGFAVVQLSLDGIGFEVLWGEFPEFAKRIRPAGISVCALGMLLLTQRFFSEGGLLPAWRGLPAALYALGLASLAGAFLLPFTKAIQFAMVTAAILLIPVILTGMVALFRGDRPARYFMAGWSLLIAGSIANIGRAFALFPVNFFTVYGAQVGSTLTLLILSFGVSERLQHAIKQRELAQKDALRAQQEANRVLDQKVQERTKDLEQSHHLLSRRNEVLHGLLEIGSTSDHQMPLDDLLALLMKRLIGVFPELHFALFIDQPDGQDAMPPIVPDLPASLINSLARYHRHLSDVAMANPSAPLRDVQLFQDINAIPIRDRHSPCLGHLFILGGPVSEADADAIKVFGEQLRMLLQNKRLHDRLDILANHDALTGVYSRAAFDAEIRRHQLAYDDTANTDFTLVLVDANGLKAVNDRYGHEAGDELIKTIADCLKDSVRGGDFVARLGGDEFVILARGVRSDIDRLIALLISDQSTLAITVADYQGNTASVPVRFSMGVASASEAGPAQALSLADERMYECKRALKKTSPPATPT